MNHFRDNNRKHTLLWNCLLLVLTLILCSNNSFAARSKSKAKQQAKEVQKLSKGSQTFSIALYKALLPSQKGNILFSPYSILSAFALSYSGAKGKTARELRRSFRYVYSPKRFPAIFARLRKGLIPPKGPNSPILHQANRLWLQKGLKVQKSYSQLLKQMFGATWAFVDFAKKPKKAASQINQWVGQQTQGMIQHIADPRTLDASTSSVLVNAIYFQGFWSSKFKKRHTKPLPFYITRRTYVKAPMMYQEARFLYYYNRRMKVLELPYKGDRYGMYLFLPRKANTLKRLERRLTARRLQRWIRKLRRTKIEVYLPRFELEQQFSLIGVLKKMGIKRAFSRKANFTGMFTKTGDFISDVEHKARMIVNEKGTRASAVTMIRKMKNGYASHSKEFKANRPFFFLILDQKTGVILFMGRVKRLKGKVHILKKTSKKKRKHIKRH